MKIFDKNIEKSQIINLIIFFIGIITVLIGVIISIQDPTQVNLPIILISVGSSIIASSIVAFISLIYISRETRFKEIIEKWGLSGIYSTRAEMNIESNRVLSEVKHDIDLIVMGMRAFRDAKGELIKEKVKNGIKIRIISMKPGSIYVKQREFEENRVAGEIQKTIEDLIKWVDELKAIAQNPINVSIKYYDSCPQDSYMRIDNKIFVGPNHYKKLSQQRISFEFKSNLLGFSYYSGYFEELWNDSEFVESTPK
jgi:hypothetical protein